MNIGVHVSFSTLVSLGYMPSSGIAGSYGGFIPSFLRNFHTIFHSGCISLHSQQKCKRIPFSLHPLQHPLQHLLFVDFLMMTILTCVMISDFSFDLHFSNNEQYWMSFHVFFSHLCLLWKNVCLDLFPTFWLGCLFFWYWLVWAACIFWKLILCQLFHSLLFSLILRAVFSPCL